ncbi:hypothetical protein [Nannocystis bainbridge]|uniref:Lipoprotein n=1 Tax=Nannocystis bainbridge TaxID=2995303 RepID=A0ABT5E8J2_9BACT|nr:hypothetical protein [Nannocystis bainbridge]MDC0722174.1 hypothetical protein [Nannocystis bainbridge]
MLRRICAAVFALTLACRGEPPPREPAADGPAARPPSAESGTADTPSPKISVCPLVPERTEPHGVAGVYQRRRGGAIGTEIWEHRATGSRPTGTGLIDRMDAQQRDRLNTVKGVNGHGFAMCCHPGHQVGYPCLMVTAEPSELDTEHLARELSAIFEKANDLDYEVIVIPDGLGH